MLKNTLVLLHVITAAGWFGLALSIGGIARRVAAERTDGLVEEGAKSIKLMNMFVVLTFVFGLLAFLLGGGFAAYGPQYHTSLLLVLILIGIQFLMIRPAWSAIATGDPAVTSARKRIGMANGIGHLIWLIVLVLMFWTRYPLV